VRSSISEKKAIGRSGKSSSFIRTARGGTFQGTCDYARAETPALAGSTRTNIGNIAQGPSDSA
jgi:hypothetical protein